MDAEIDRYLVYLSEVRNASPHTVRAYSADLVGLARFLDSEEIAAVGEITPLHLRLWLAELTERSLAPNSRAHIPPQLTTYSASYARASWTGTRVWLSARHAGPGASPGSSPRTRWAGSWPLPGSRTATR